MAYPRDLLPTRKGEEPTKNALGDGAEVSTGDAQTRALNWCFGVSMSER